MKPAPASAPSSRSTQRYSLSSFFELKPVCDLRGYFIVGRCAKSATGETYLAFREEDEGLSRSWYALKLLSSLVERQPELLAKVDREIARSEAFDHPAVVSVSDTIAAASQRLVVFPWVRGISLRAPVQDAEIGQSAIRWDLAVFVFRQVCAALRDVMEEDPEGVRVHGAIIPQNIVVDEKGSAHVLNLGLDILRAGAQDLNIVYPFRAPEIRASGKATAVADVFGVGVCLLEMIAVGAARQLLENPSATSEVVDRICVRAKCPTTLSALIARAVAVDPARRFASLASLADALSRVPLVLEEDDLRDELLSSLREQRELGFDRPPAMETANLRIADLAETVRLSEVATDVEVEPPPQGALDRTEPQARDEALSEGVVHESVDLPVNRQFGRGLYFVAATLLMAAAVGVWSMSDQARETEEMIDARSDSVAEPQVTALAKPSDPPQDPSSLPAATVQSSRPVGARSQPDTSAAVAAPGRSLDGGQSVGDAATDSDVGESSDAGKREISETSRTRRRRSPPRRRHQKKILADPGF